MTNAWGSVTWRQDYMAFGQDYAATATGNNYKFNGKPLEAAGLYYYGARYYSPELGRFVSPDAIAGDLENPQTLNPYVYCCNNPMSNIDKDGEWSIFTHFFRTLFSELAFGIEHTWKGIYHGNWNEFKLGFSVLVLSPVTATCSMWPDISRFSNRYLGTNFKEYPGGHGSYWGKEGYDELTGEDAKRSTDPMKRGRMYHAKQDEEIHDLAFAGNTMLEAFYEIAGTLMPWLSFFDPEPVYDMSTQYGFDKKIQDTGREGIGPAYQGKQNGEKIKVLGSSGRTTANSWLGMSTNIHLFRPTMFGRSTFRPATD